MSGIEISVTEELLKELTEATRRVMLQYELGGSDLVNSIDWEYNNDQFMLLANDYFIWVSTGRRPGARKVPVEELIKWIRKKNIRPQFGYTVNSLAFALQNSIYKAGIKAKNLVDPITEVTTDIIAEYIAEDLAETTAEEIAKMLTFTLGKE